MTQCVSGLRIWDLSLERDAEEEALYQAQLKKQQAEAPQDLPPQLLFVHQVYFFSSTGIFES